MKIKICTWYDDNIKSFANKCFIINKIYCKKFGYSLIKSDKLYFPNKKPHWQRLGLLLEHIKDCDYIIWIDADAFFIKHKKIENIILANKDKSIIFCEDKNNTLSPLINSGVMIFKNNDDSIKFLKNCLKKNYQKGGKKLWPMFNDQAVIRYLYAFNIDNLKTNSVITKFGTLQNLTKTIHNYNVGLIYHMAGISERLRHKIINIYLKHGIRGICAYDKLMIIFSKLKQKYR